MISLSSEVNQCLFIFTKQATELVDIFVHVFGMCPCIPCAE